MDDNTSTSKHLTKSLGTTQSLPTFPSTPAVLAQRVAGWVLVFALFALSHETAMACPTCRDTLHENGARLQWGYAMSIGLMMLAPFGILVGWVAAIYRMVRQGQSAATSTGQSN